MFGSKIRRRYHADLSARRYRNLNRALHLVLGISFDCVKLGLSRDDPQNFHHADGERGVEENLAVELWNWGPFEPAIDDSQILNFHGEAQGLFRLPPLYLSASGIHVF